MDEYAKIVYQPKSTPGFPYNIRIIVNGYYSGKGRFCRNTDEVCEWINENYPGIEVR